MNFTTMQSPLIKDPQGTQKYVNTAVFIGVGARYILCTFWTFARCSGLHVSCTMDFTNTRFRQACIKLMPASVGSHWFIINIVTKQCDPVAK